MASCTIIGHQLGRLLQVGVERGSKFCLVNSATHTTFRTFDIPARQSSCAAQLLRPKSPTTTNVLRTQSFSSTELQAQHCFLPSIRRYFSSQEPQMMSSTLTDMIPNSMSIIDDEPFPNIPISEMSNEELADTSTIHGWDLIHSPPKKLPRGALIGTVISDKMDKTVNVSVVRFRIVPKIRKRIRYTRKFMAHDEKEVANMGDLVMITPCHRISKHKHFMLREIIRHKGQL